MTRWLIYSGFLTSIIFWATTILCGLIIGDYNHTVRLVSELGAIGTKSQYFFMAGLLISSILSVLFIFGLYKTCKQIGLYTIPILIILTFSFSIGGAALFPLPLRLHGILGSPSIFLFLSPLLALILWKTEKISHIKTYSLIAFALMSLGFLVYIPNFLNEFSGLKQRLFHVGWTFWFIYLAAGFIRINKKSHGNKSPVTN